MIKSAAASVIAASALLAGGAVQAQTWHFSYTGFLDSSSGLFDDNYSIGGSFSGSDANTDGILDLSEITMLVVNGTDYHACAGDSNAYYHCGIDSFSYDLGGRLDFTAGIHGRDPEGMVGGGHYFQAGDGEYEYRYTPGSYAQSSHLWTSDTAFAVSSGVQRLASPMILAAVPEPGTWAMLATGLLLIGGTVLRRRAQAIATHPATAPSFARS